MQDTAHTQELIKTAAAMVADYKGLVALDESIATLDKRFEAAGIPQTAEYRRAYREVLITSPGINAYINGAILFEETVYQQTVNGVPFIDVLKKAGIIPGIKLDEGTADLPGFPAPGSADGGRVGHGGGGLLTTRCTIDGGLQHFQKTGAGDVVVTVWLLQQSPHMVLRIENGGHQLLSGRHVALADTIKGRFAVMGKRGKGIKAKHGAGSLERV